MELNAEQKLGEVVAEDYRTTEVFKKYKFDFYCGGSMTIAEACKENHVDQECVLRELEKILQSENHQTNYFLKKSLNEVIDIIINQHHSYIYTNIPILQELLRKTMAIHGQNHPQLRKASSLFMQTSHELTKHMQKEEFILFPYLRKMVASIESGVRLETPKLISVINEMLNDHENEGERFTLIQQITNDFCPPKDACDIFKTTYQKLREFHDDLLMHIHLENNILFPMIVRLRRDEGRS